MGKKVIPSRKGSSTRNFFSGGAAWAAGAAGAAEVVGWTAAPEDGAWGAGAAGLAAGAAAGAQDASARQSTSPKDAHAVSGRIASVLSPLVDHQRDLLAVGYCQHIAIQP